MLGITLCATDATPVRRSCLTAEPVAETRSIVTPFFRGTAKAPIAPPSSPAIKATVSIARHGVRARGRAGGGGGGGGGGGNVHSGAGGTSVPRGGCSVVTSGTGGTSG